MLPFFCVLFTFATASGTKLVRFGEVASAETLFPLPTHAASSFALNTSDKDVPVRPKSDVSKESQHQRKSDRSTKIYLESSVSFHDDNGQAGRRWAKERRADNSDSENDSDESSDDDDDDDSQHENDSDNGSDSENDDTDDGDSDEPEFSGDDSDGSIFVPDEGQKKKPGAAKTMNEDVPNGPLRGVMQLDCLTTPEGCQNACYYQNCVMGAKGDYTKVTYQKSDLDMEQYNRVQSGQGVSGAGTPCKTGPFAQKF